MLITILQLIINGLLLGGIYALVSIGLCLIFGVIEIINFAHGEFLMLGMFATYWLFYLGGLDPYLSLLILGPVFFFFGSTIQRVIIQPMLDTPPLNQIFATIGLSMVFQNLALLFWKADYRTLKTTYSGTILQAEGLMIGFSRLMAFLIAVGVMVVLFLFLKKTYIGKAIRALSQERMASMLMGINVHRTYQIAFGIGIACTAIAGVALMPVYYAFPSVGGLFVLTAFVVVILGGYNSLAGTLIGGLVIGMVESFSGFFISPHLKEAVYFIIFMLILIVRPTGLLGHKENV